MKDEWVTGKIGITIQDQPLNFEVTVPAKPVKLTRMLPVFHKMTNTMVGLGIDAAKLNGQEVSCKAGCGACCRQPVPITEAEVFQLAALVERMDEPERLAVEQKFDNAVKHFDNIDWFEKVSKCAAAAMDGQTEEAQKKLVELVHQYFTEGISCPFLKNDACSIHEWRPMACREYLVTSPAEFCDDPDPINIKKVEMLFQPSKVVSKISSTGNFAGEGIITLIKALEFAKVKKESEKVKTGEGWMADFFQTLAASESLQPTAGSKTPVRPKSRSAKKKKKK